MRLTVKDCLKVGISIFLLYLAIHHWKDALGLALAVIGAASPLIIGCVIAYLVNILMSIYERNFAVDNSNVIVNKLRRPVCMLMAFLTLLIIVFLVVILVVPQLGSCVSVIVSGIPGFMENALKVLRETNIFSADTLASLESIDWQSQFSQIVKLVGSGIGSVVDLVITAVASVFDWVVTALVSVIFSIYLLAGKEKLAQQFSRILRRYLPEKGRHAVAYVLEVLDDCFRRYIVGQCTEAVILGILCGVGMWLLKLPYAMMVGTLVAFTALIPIAGAYIGAGVGAFMILTVDPFKALVFLVFLVILQQLEGNLIYPRVVGSSIGLPGIWVLAAVTIGGGIMGVAGMLLGVPLAAACYRFLRDDVTKAELPEEPAERKEAPETDSSTIDLI